MSDVSDHSKWEHYEVCTECGQPLKDSTIYYGGGVCPHCGYDNHSTICAHRKVVRRKIYTDTRKLAIKAQKLRKSNIIVRFFSHFARSPKRSFVWEYREPE